MSKVDWNAAAKATGHVIALCASIAAFIGMIWLVIWLAETERYQLLAAIPFVGIALWFWSFCYGEYRIDNMRNRERKRTPHNPTGATHD